jgi:hypothetical protein
MTTKDIVKDLPYRMNLSRTPVLEGKPAFFYDHSLAYSISEEDYILKNSLDHMLEELLKVALRELANNLEEDLERLTLVYGVNPCRIVLTNSYIEEKLKDNGNILTLKQGYTIKDKCYKELDKER